MPLGCFCAKRKQRAEDHTYSSVRIASDTLAVDEGRLEASEPLEDLPNCIIQDDVGTPASHAKISGIRDAVMTPETEAVTSIVVCTSDEYDTDVDFGYVEDATTRVVALAESSSTTNTPAIQNADMTTVYEPVDPSSDLDTTSPGGAVDAECTRGEVSVPRFDTVYAEIPMNESTIRSVTLATGNDSPSTELEIGCDDNVGETEEPFVERLAESPESTGASPIMERESHPQMQTDDEKTTGEELYYIDEFGMKPGDQYNSATNVSFFNQCSATLGYPTARLLQYRLSGIMSLPETRRS